MELKIGDRLISRNIKKILRQHKENIFSVKLNNNLTQSIMNYLEIKSKFDFAKTCIFIFNAFIDFENSIIFEKIKEKIQSKICTIFLNNLKFGIGYFCILHFSLNKLMHSLIINNHINNESLFKNQNNKIKLSIKNKGFKEIDLNNRVI
jgi:hypothetical protein